MSQDLRKRAKFDLYQKFEIVLDLQSSLVLLQRYGRLSSTSLRVYTYIVEKIAFEVKLPLLQGWCYRFGWSGFNHTTVQELYTLTFCSIGCVTALQWCTEHLTRMKSDARVVVKNAKIITR